MRVKGLLCRREEGREEGRERKGLKGERIHGVTDWRKEEEYGKGGREGGGEGGREERHRVGG